jgi:hypothetical protein
VAAAALGAGAAAVSAAGLRLQPAAISRAVTASSGRVDAARDEESGSDTTKWIGARDGLGLRAREDDLR